jgi:hypothetical protein
MSRTGEEVKVPPRFDDENNMNNNQEDDKSRAFRGTSLEDLMRRLEKIKARKERNALPQAKMKTPHLKRMSQRKGRKEETITISISITQCLSIMIICLALPFTLPYPFLKLSTLMELIIINGSIA